MALYRVSLRYNDSYAFREFPQLTDNQRIHQELVPDQSGAARPDSRRCKACGELLAKWEDSLSGLIIKKKKYDISSTYDGIMVVSGRLKSVYEEAGLTGLVFHQVPDDPLFFAIRATRAVLFDAERRKTRFIKCCPVCENFESVVGATPICLKAGFEVEGREFVRTDLEFGSGDEKSPLLICGEIAANFLSTTNLKGLNLVPIEHGKENIPK